LGKLGLGIVVGATAAILAVALLDAPVENGKTPAAPGSAGSDREAIVFDGGGGQALSLPSAPTGAAPAAPGAESEQGLAPTPGTYEAEEARLERRVEEARQALVGARRELVALQRSRELAEIPLVSAIPLPAEFDWLQSDAPNAYYFRERLQREGYDASWADQAGAGILKLVYDRPEIVQDYGQPTITCRATLCEVTFLAYGVARDETAVRSDAMSLFDAAVEDLPGTFDCALQCELEVSVQGGIATIFWGVTRAGSRTRVRASVAAAVR